MVLRNEAFGPYRRPSRVRTRTRQLAALVQVLALAIATLLLMPLVVQADPGDPFALAGPGDRGLRCDFAEALLPDDTSTCSLVVANAASSDAAMFLFADHVTVTRCADAACSARRDVDAADPDFATYADAWELSVSEAGGTVCEAAPVTAYRAGPLDAMCGLGVVAGAHAPAAPRTYVLALTNRDEGTDRTRFGDWDLRFDLVLRARVPA